MTNRKVQSALLALTVVAILLMTIGGKRRTSKRLSAQTITDAVTFPRSFLWGTATAAGQLEPTQASDWAELMRKSQAGEGARVAGAARKDLHQRSEAVIRLKTGHSEKLAEDVALMRDLGANAYRFSIAWDRLFPRAGMAQADAVAVAFYDKLFAELKKHEIEPSVTLFHFSSPAWFFEMEIAALYEPPFSDHHAQGTEGLFPEQDIDTLVHIIQGISTNASFPPANDPGSPGTLEQQT